MTAPPPLPRIRATNATRSPSLHRSPWAWLNLVLGILLGFALALGIAWGVAPPPAQDVALHSLRPDYQADVLLLIAQNYQRHQDWQQTQSELAQLKLSDAPNTVVQQTESLINNQAPQVQIRAMVALARQLGRLSPAMEPYLP